VPLNSEGYFFEPLWTDFTPLGPTPGVLDWYTLLVGVLALSALVLHGASFISLRTEQLLQAHARAMAGRWWLPTMVLTILATLATFSLRPALLGNFAASPWGGVFPALAMAGLIGVAVFSRRGRDDLSLVASGTYLAGMLASTAFALYPNLLPAVDPARSLTVTNAAGAPYGLAVGLVWWSIAMILAAVYFVVLYRLFGGKVRLTEEGY
jgi:cytochrome d ubiquinol oxidase subunit II